jgi:hypothetical protein
MVPISLPERQTSECPEVQRLSGELQGQAWPLLFPSAVCEEFFAQIQLYANVLAFYFMMKTTKKSKKAVSKAATPPAPAMPAAGKQEPVAAMSEMVAGPRVVLEWVDPGAKQVFVAGSFNDWKPEQSPLVAAGNGLWTGDLKVTPGRYEYLFVVDGKWLPDPNAKETVANPFGGQNSVLTVSA